MTRTDLPTLAFASAADWEAWLEEHHATSTGIWLKLAKLKSGIASVTYPEALDGALCYGWIDGQKASTEEPWWLQRFTPRRPRSKWSQINREKIAALIAADRMKPAGLREVEQAQADGRWEAAYPSQANITVPDDFQAALDANPAAAAFFATLQGSARYSFLYRVHDARKPDTRAKRIASLIDLLNEGKKLR